MTQKINLYINGAFTASTATAFLPVENPATQEIIAEVPLTELKEIDQAIALAGEAFKTWKEE